MSSKAIAEIMDGYNPHIERRKETKKLIEKWEATGLLEGLGDENKIHTMAQLLENQARQLIDESSRVGGPGTEEWSGVALPLVRRIFGELAAQEFVSVQPMNLPSGLIFYLDFKYGTANQGFSAGEDVYGNTSASGDPSGGLYGAGKFAYSTNEQETGAQTIHASSVASGTYTTGSVAARDIDYEPSLTIGTAGADNSLIKVNVSTAGMTRPDKEAVRAMVVSGSGFDEYFPAYTKLSGSSDEVVFIVRQDAAGTLGPLTVKYSAQPTDSTRGDFEVSSTEDWAGNTGDVGIPEIDIQLRQVSIVAKTRKLKAVWTPELAQDLNAYHSVDAEAELTSMLSEYVSMEIDLEIIDMLRANADAKTEYWSARVGYERPTGGGAFAQSSGESNAYTKGEWFQTLGNKVQSVSNAIHQKTLRGGANWMVVSPESATIIESIPGYAADTDGDAMKNSFAMGVQKVGMLNSRFTVYKNPYMLENTILIGFRGSNFLETGAVYAPYVPLIMTPLVYDPSNFTPRKGVMTRYAKKMVRPEFYGKVVVADVNYV